MQKQQDINILKWSAVFAGITLSSVLIYKYINQKVQNYFYQTAINQTNQKLQKLKILIYQRQNHQPTFSQLKQMFGLVFKLQLELKFFEWTKYQKQRRSKYTNQLIKTQKGFNQYLKNLVEFDIKIFSPQNFMKIVHEKIIYVLGEQKDFQQLTMILGQQMLVITDQAIKDAANFKQRIKKQKKYSLQQGAKYLMIMDKFISQNALNIIKIIKPLIQNLQQISIHTTMTNLIGYINQDACYRQDSQFASQSLEQWRQKYKKQMQVPLRLFDSKIVYILANCVPKQKRNGYFIKDFSKFKIDLF